MGMPDVTLPFEKTAKMAMAIVRAMNAIKVNCEKLFFFTAEPSFVMFAEKSLFLSPPSPPTDVRSVAGYCQGRGHFFKKTHQNIDRLSGRRALTSARQKNQVRDRKKKARAHSRGLGDVHNYITSTSNTPILQHIYQDKVHWRAARASLLQMLRCAPEKGVVFADGLRDKEITLNILRPNGWPVDRIWPECIDACLRSPIAQARDYLKDTEFFVSGQAERTRQGQDFGPPSHYQLSGNSGILPKSANNAVEDIGYPTPSVIPRNVNQISVQ